MVSYAIFTHKIISRGLSVDMEIEKAERRYVVDPTAIGHKIIQSQAH